MCAYVGGKIDLHGACYCECDVSVGNSLPKYTSQMSIEDLHVLEATASPENVRVWNHGLGSRLGRRFEHETDGFWCCQRTK